MDTVKIMCGALSSKASEEVIGVSKMINGSAVCVAVGGMKGLN